MNKAVIGGGFGDEAKGVVTDFLCSRSINPLVVRYSGGHQAGHTVVVDGVRHVFSSFGSGTLRGDSTYLSRFCTISPIAIKHEYQELVEKRIKPKLFIDMNCPVITPYDKYYNMKRDSRLQHGTCGVGFGSTIEREESNYHFTASDLEYSSVTQIKLKMIQNYYGADATQNIGVRMEQFHDAVKFLLSCTDIEIVDESILEAREFPNIIFEGSQGLLLDKDIGFFPHVTRSNTGTRNILELCEKEPQCYIVTRAYQTRHGNGDMTNDNIPHNIKVNPLETNVTNDFQGNFRRSLLDLDLLRYAIEKDGNIIEPILMITCLDHVQNEYRFTNNGIIVNCDSEYDFVKKIANILNCKQVYINDSEESKTFKYRMIK